MMAAPALIPVTTPRLSTEVLALPLLQVPPVVASARVVVAPGHTSSLPVIPAGGRLTVTVVAAVQPVPNEYSTGAVPAATPVTMPLLLPIVILLLVVLHKPPPAVLLRLVALPMQTCSSPPITDGEVLTDTV